MKTRYAVLILPFLGFVACERSAPKAYHETRALRDFELLDVTDFHSLQDVFNTPISKESFTLETPIKKAESPVEISQSVPFLVKEGEPLSLVLNRLVEVNDHRIEWGETNGCVFIKQLPTKTQAARENIMERRISLAFDSESPWAAIKKIGELINAAPESKRPFVIQPGSMDRLSSHKPPRELTENVSFSLKLNNVSVRDAITRIIQASSLKTSYFYLQVAPSDFEHPDFLVLYWFKNDSSARPTEQDEIFWHKEMADFRQAFSDAHPSSKASK